ncbi:MAG: exonuclease III [Sulfitobacter sp.]|jgi:exonuclease III
MNGLGNPKQISYFNDLDVDLAIIPELKQKNIEQLKPNDAVWITNNHTNKVPKGLGVLTFGDLTLTELDRDIDMELYLPLKVSGKNIDFNLLAVWNFYHACKQGRFKDAMGEDALEWAAINRHTEQLEEPCLVGGDWNFGPTFSQPAFLRMCEMYAEKGYRSLYHEFFDLDCSASEHPTYRSPTKHYHHLDHFFGTQELVDRMINLEIPDVDEAILSDHAPVVLTINLGKTVKMFQSSPTC